MCFHEKQSGSSTAAPRGGGNSAPPVTGRGRSMAQGCGG
ncbi:hypothetical protein LHGZ1_2306 [Laribacter hongkongensis]|uniref:Uncharacterized protein n=1 Tax=Laribacter hongkongensis TaxID=168471 RepID=A0A248LK56_9NEIS|nr:hypothetical protein LHGZ1_2306 [Laribacter hongkongensis]